MSKEIKLFDLIKNHQYDNLIQIIKGDDNIDLNEVDDTGVYLIQYAIMFRQRDIVALLISRNCKLDILDTDGRSIFYLPIKFGYVDIVRLLINFSNVVVGIPLFEMQDNFLNIPLHYAIMFNRFDIIEEMLNIKSNINFKDIDGNTALHLIVKNLKKENINLVEMMINKKIGINHTNKLGQNALHIAIEHNNMDICKILLDNDININTETLDDHLTPLLIATIQSNYEMIKLLLKYDPNINCQDIYGNSILNHAILNKSKQIIKLFYEKINVNLINISGHIALQLFFDNNYELDKLDDYMFKEILLKTKLNLQNNVGKTSWHYLVDNNIWYKYSDILLIKKNKIFIQDFDGKSPYDIICEKFIEQKDKFIYLIAYSFYQYIILNPADYKLDIKCSKDLLVKKNLSDKEKKICIDSIKKLIVDSHISFPEIKKSYCINDLNLETIKFSSYTGITLDILVGMIYLKNKYNNVQTSLTADFISNEKLEKYYKSNGIQKSQFDEFLNFEIIWSYQKIFYPNILKQIIDTFIKDQSKQFLIIPIGIELSNGAHANILLYDKEHNSLERYEPYGKDFPPGFNYNPEYLDHNLKNLFINYFTDVSNQPFKYYKPSTYEQKIGLQLLDTIEYSKEKNIGDPGGFCAAWSLWYIEMRISNIKIEKGELLQKLINYIRLKKVSFRSVIRSFTKNITDIRDEFLNKADIDINQWLNDNYTEKQWNIIVNYLKKSI